MRLHWFEDMEEDGDRPYDMEEPNFFGLSIAYDPYMREVVQADGFTTCGGDGGCSICGGLGLFLGFLPCSPCLLYTSGYHSEGGSTHEP